MPRRSTSTEKPSKRLPVELPAEARELLDRAVALLRQESVSEADRLLADSCRELAKELRLVAVARAASKAGEAEVSP